MLLNRRLRPRASPRRPVTVRVAQDPIQEASKVALSAPGLRVQVVLDRRAPVRIAAPSSILVSPFASRRKCFRNFATPARVASAWKLAI